MSVENEDEVSLLILNGYILPGTSKKKIDATLQGPFRKGGLKDYTYIQNYTDNRIWDNSDYHNNPNDFKVLFRFSENDFALNENKLVTKTTFMYEWLRTFLQHIGYFIVDLGRECSCTKMSAGDAWQFLCASHQKPMDCYAIDYCVHTVDTVHALVANPAFYPDRFDISEKNTKAFGSFCRRLYRIFAHANFHHISIFRKYEDSYHLCKKFYTFCREYNLVPIPPPPSGNQKSPQKSDFEIVDFEKKIPPKK